MSALLWAGGVVAYLLVAGGYATARRETNRFRAQTDARDLWITFGIAMLWPGVVCIQFGMRLQEWFER